MNIVDYENIKYNAYNIVFLIILGLTRLTSINHTQHNFNIQRVQTCFEEIKLCKSKSAP